MIYLYAITEAEARPPRCAGIEDSEVRLVPVGEVAGVCSTHKHLEVRPQPDLLWRHEQVVETAMEGAATLPARFGTTLDDDEALVALLVRDGRLLRRQLDRVRGCVELAVRVGLAEEGPIEPPAQDGRGYLAAKLKARQREQAIFRDTLEPLTHLAVRACQHSSRSETDLVCASYLVPNQQVDRFSHEVTSVGERNPELWVSCTGPWPPYSFATLEEAV